ncbi:hypothetical protein ACH5RR_035083 [Cinchona calisaya]|uniref:Allene oxide synthase n=1 Tax=Cinchona calisaya TaxID=153742 RepID=A0ABD2YCT5_9GENT
MALSSLAFPPLHLQLPSSHRSSSSKPFPHNKLILHPIKASISETPSYTPKPTDATSSPAHHQPTKLPLRKIPGEYGLPLIGPFKDRLDYFYNQGREEYFKSRIQKYQSTVFRTNMPPGPFISSNPNVVVLLDGKSFPVLFDVSKVEKRDLFTGTFMPSTELTGGYRVLSYLDPSEPNHAQLKKLMFFHLSSRRDHVIPEFQNSYKELFDTLDKELSTHGKANFNSLNDQATFNFLARALYAANPPDTKLGQEGPKLIGKWVVFQLHPVLKLGLPNFLEDLLIHTFRLPPALVKKDYQKLYDFFYKNSTFVLDEAERMGISREEACHNLIFATCFNSFGGMRILFANMLKWIGRAGVKLHTELAQEIRSALKPSVHNNYNNKMSLLAAIEKMPLTKSVVYEALRIEPPVPTQYGKAKSNFIIESHDSKFEVKEGEMLFGYQPFATKDPKIFDRSEEFVPERFLGEDGEKLLKHVLWSNGPETESPNVNNKQCAGKDFVVLVSRLLLVEFFRRYDSFEIEVGSLPLGSSVTVTSLKRATSF